ncbi:uncharacterized protein isoform X2 [Choristoneura fumiferana]
MEPRRRRMRTTFKQLKLLVKFMADNPCLAKGVDYRTAFGKHYHDTKWTELANLMNAQENGMNKSPREWNRYWKDLKSGIRKKVHAMKMKPGQRKIVLNSIEQVIYKNMCENKYKKVTGADDKTRSYLHIPPESDKDVDDYEVEYLEESSCDEAKLTNVTGMELVTDLAFNNIHFNSEAVHTNVRPESLLDGDNFLIENLLNESSSTAAEQNLTNHKTANNVTNEDVFNVKEDYETNPDVLTDIRDQLKELVQIQKEKAKSAHRMAAAYERRAILEEKRVRIEERRLKMEERRVALEERKIEAAEKRSFAEERIATAAERRNDLEEHRMVDGT